MATPPSPDAGSPSPSQSAHEPPQTAEGWYMLHERWTLDWNLWKHLEGPDRERTTGEFVRWLKKASAAGGEGDSAPYVLVGQKGDLLLLHYRKSIEQLYEVQASFRAIHFADYLRPAGSFLSVAEASLYEASAIAQWKLGEKKIAPASPGYAAALDKEIAQQRTIIEKRLFRQIPEQSHLCFYPMNKRRGEHVNWYAQTMDERRGLMKGHGRIGHKYAQQVTQVISGAIGLDDWEWGVDLHADDPLVFKKLITEMRYDPASSLYAEFGEFIIGLRKAPDELQGMMAG